MERRHGMIETVAEPLSKLPFNVEVTDGKRSVVGFALGNVNGTNLFTRVGCERGRQQEL
ncbi:hypothetical protein ACOME3_000836 [Neoechinorhynchus agilis]